MSNNQKKPPKQTKYSEHAKRELHIIGSKIRDEIPLEFFERTYIAGALLKIGNGEEAEKALGLTNPNHRPISMPSKVWFNICDEVEKLQKDPRFLHKSSGDSNENKIFKELASREDIRNLLKVKDGQRLTVDRIKKIYERYQDYMDAIKIAYSDDPNGLELLNNIEPKEKKEKTR